MEKHPDIDTTAVHVATEKRDKTCRLAETLRTCQVQRLPIERVNNADIYHSSLRRAAALETFKKDASRLSGS